MGTRTNLPRSIALSTRLYQAILAIYPSEFRRDYGGPMLQVFRDSGLRALKEAGANGLLSLWSRTMLDTVQSAIEEHSQRGVDMSKEKFVKLSGWALIVAGLCFLFGAMAAMRPKYSRYNPFSLPIDRYANLVASPLFAMFLLLLSVGLVGLFLRYQKRIGNFGRFSLGLGAISGVIGAVGAIAMTTTGSQFWTESVLWAIFFGGMTLELLCLALFGIASLLQKSLPHWNALPLLAGIWVPLNTIWGTISELSGGRWVEWPQVANMALLLVTSLGLAGLGYLLQSDSLPADRAAVAV